MKIELVSYSSWDPDGLEKRFKASIMRDVLANSSSDIVMFPGSSILSLNDFMHIVNDPTITIKVKLVIFEVSSLKKTKKGKGNKSKDKDSFGLSYCYDIVHGRFILDAFRQRYATGSNLDRCPCLFDAMYDEWKNGLRRFCYRGRRFTILMCGETAMLKCDRVDGKIGPAKFRIPDPQALADYQEMMNETDVFLNPIHTIQGNQGKIKRRRDVFSSNDKVYFSTASLEDGKVSAKHASLQYAVCNGIDLPPIPGGIKNVGKYISRVFEI